jgi:phosphatidylinositol-3-phosphatase
MKRFTAVAALAAAGIAALVTVQIAGATARHDNHEHGRSGVRHIFVIVLENHSQQSVIGDPNAPYITRLAHRYASAADYYGVTHPSEPNYVALISGSNWWINDDNPANRFDHTNLVDELQAAHKTWGAYMEAMPGNDKTTDYWPSSADPLYASKHNPFVLFNDIRNDPAQMANVKPYTSFAEDLAKERTTPDFSFIVPDQCNDMHGGVYDAIPGHPETPCPYNSTNDDPNDIALKHNADEFVEKTVHTIMHSPSWHEGQDAIFVVSDEGDYTGNTVNGGWDSPAGCCDSPVAPAGDPSINTAWPGGVYGGGLVPAVVVVNRDGKTHGYVSDTPYNHYSLLATIEDVWNLPKLAYTADTAQVTPMTEFLTK